MTTCMHLQPLRCAGGAHLPRAAQGGRASPLPHPPQHTGVNADTVRKPARNQFAWAARPKVRKFARHQFAWAARPKDLNATNDKPVPPSIRKSNSQPISAANLRLELGPVHHTITFLPAAAAAAGHGGHGSRQVPRGRGPVQRRLVPPRPAAAAAAAATVIYMVIGLRSREMCAWVFIMQCLLSRALARINALRAREPAPARSRNRRAMRARSAPV